MGVEAISVLPSAIATASRTRVWQDVTCVQERKEGCRDQKRTEGTEAESLEAGRSCESENGYWKLREGIPEVASKMSSL